MLGVTFIALSSGGNVLAFIDIPAFVIVSVFALLFSMAYTKSIKTRVRNFSDGAVLGGWIGAIIGTIMLLNSVDSSNLEWLPNLRELCFSKFSMHICLKQCVIFF